MYRIASNNWNEIWVKECVSGSVYNVDCEKLICNRKKEIDEIIFAVKKSYAFALFSMRINKKKNKAKIEKLQMKKRKYQYYLYLHV